MTFIDGGAIFLSSLALVFLLGFQQRVVQAERMTLAFIGSSLLGVAQTLITRAAVGDDLMMFLIANCLGGSCGIVLSIWVYRRLYGKRTDRD